MEENKKDNKNQKRFSIKHSKKRNFVVIVFLIIACIVAYISFRGRYLEILEIGSNYIGVFEKNLWYKSLTIIATFIFIFILIYITNNRIKKGLEDFFNDEKKEMPKFPNKSISLIIATVVSTLTSNMIVEKAILFFNSTSFGFSDKVFSHDIGYYLFQKPFIEFVLLYVLISIVAATVYAGVYYLIVLNKCFNGVRSEILKNSKIVYQLLNNAKIISVLLAIYFFITTQDLSGVKFLALSESNGYYLYGAGFSDVTIKLWGYRILSLLIIYSVFMAVSAYKKGKTKKVIKNILIVPIYLLVLFLVLVFYNLVLENSNRLDKEKKYISYNIETTRQAYGINITENEIENGGTISESVINENSDVLNNVAIANNDLILKYLNGTLTSKGYYKYSTAQIGEYASTNGLVYVSPREIVSSEATYNNKTYEYTHGYGVVLSSATITTDDGAVEIAQKADNTSIEQNVKITEPRIYYGLETNETVVTNSKTKDEFDYIDSDGTTAQTNVYTGESGLQLGWLDRMVLAISNGDIKLAVSSDVDKESKILTNRNIIQRAKEIMPYLTYDNEPYLVVRDDGELVWVLDAYTTSEYYPYSQKTSTNNSDEINYIRNSVKVIIDAYDGSVKFYITDRTDPIVMAYRNAYPDLFQNLEETIPEDISSHFVYPQYLYNIQAEMIKRYHNVQPDVLYRSSDVWEISTYNNGISDKSSSSAQVSPYYTMIKTIDDSESKLGLVLPYTMAGKQNITSYLVGTYANGSPELTLYKFPSDSSVLGLMQLDTQIEQNENIYKQISSLEVTGTKITKNTVVIPIDNYLLYVEAIYQEYINESDSLPTLKKVVVASGNKVAIGDDLKSALKNLASQYAVNIQVETTDNVDDLITLIIKANKNLEESSSTNDWEMIGKDLQNLQTLIDQLEVVVNEQKTNETVDTNTVQ